MELLAEDLKILAHSKSKLENIVLIMQGLNIVGDKIEKSIKIIPEKRQKQIGEKANYVLMAAIQANLKTMSKNKGQKDASNKSYKTIVFASGVGFGFAGFVGFAADLLLTTKFMLRSILDIARSKGEDIFDIETQLSCLSVFALGGKSKSDDGLETSYYATRMALSNSIKMTTEYVAKNGVTPIIDKLATGSPLAQLISKIASNYQAAAIEKFVADWFPVVGAVSGGTINLVFIHHFQKMAEAHFTIRQLERKYGEEVIREKYNEIRVN